MNLKTYQIIDTFDPSKDYGIHIKKGVAKQLAVLKKGEMVDSGEFLRINASILNPKAKPLSWQKHVSATLAVGVKIGILQQVDLNPISFRDFCKLDGINYLKEQLRGHQYQNLTPQDPMGLGSTQRTYIYALYRFNNWLVGREFEFTQVLTTGSDTFKKIRQKIVLTGLEHLLQLYKDSIQSEPDFVKIIKKYLLDPIHVDKRAAGIKVDHAAIVAYFEKNDFPIRFKFDAKVKYSTNEDEKSLSLEDLMNMLTVGKPSITQKAVFLCKFQRGLDTTTLCDRFNFQAWDQLVNYFGIDQYLKWDLSKCPAPIKLTRMKTDFPHIGFLDRDALVSVQKYLDYRYEKTGKAMQEGQPIFLNSKNQPIREKWVRKSFSRIAKTSGVQKRLNRKGAIRYEKDSHELRDLLKSTLLDCNVRPDVADHVIGHKQKDSYEKQAMLYPENMRKEYAKASKMLNIFSKFSNLLKGGEDPEEMRGRIITLETNLAKISRRLEWAEKTRRKN